MNEANTGRRRLLKIAASAPLLGRAATSVLAGGMTLPFSPSARASGWGLALSAASSLAGLVASSQRADGGISASIDAALDYMRIMSGQLTSIQTGLAEVISAIGELETKFRDELRAERALVLHHSVAAQIKNYQNEYERYTKGRFLTVGDWQNDERTVKTLYSIDSALETAVNNSAENGLLGPLTALQLPSAMFCALAVRVGLKERSTALAVRAEQYMARFDLCADRARAGSTAAQMEAALARLNESAARLKSLGVTIPEETSTKPITLFDRAFAVVCEAYETQPRGDCRSGCTSTWSSGRLYRSYLQIGRDTTPIDPRVVRPLVVSSGIPMLLKEGSGRTKSDPFPDFPHQHLAPRRTDFGTACPTEREKWDGAAVAYVAQDLKLGDQVRTAVDLYNQNMAHVALCSCAMASLWVARQSLLKSFRRGV